MPIELLLLLRRTSYATCAVQKLISHEHAPTKTCILLYELAGVGVKFF